MLKKVEYIECDCGKGELKPLTKTNISWPGSFGLESLQEEFFECSHCNTIWARQVNHGEFGYRGEPSYHDFSRYQGNLTKEELAKYAKDCSGPLWPNGFNEKKIKAQRHFSVKETDQGTQISINKKLAKGKLEKLIDELTKMIIEEE